MALIIASQAPPAAMARRPWRRVVGPATRADSPIPTTYSAATSPHRRVMAIQTHAVAKRPR